MNDWSVIPVVTVEKSPYHSLAFKKTKQSGSLRYGLITTVTIDFGGLCNAKYICMMMQNVSLLGIGLIVGAGIAAVDNFAF